MKFNFFKNLYVYLRGVPVQNTVTCLKIREPEVDWGRGKHIVTLQQATGGGQLQKHEQTLLFGILYV